MHNFDESKSLHDHCFYEELKTYQDPEKKHKLLDENKILLIDIDGIKNVKKYFSLLGFEIGTTFTSIRDIINEDINILFTKIYFLNEKRGKSYIILPLIRETTKHTVNKNDIFYRAIRKIKNFFSRNTPPCNIITDANEQHTHINIVKKNTITTYVILRLFFKNDNDSKIQFILNNQDSVLKTITCLTNDYINTVGVALSHVIHNKQNAKKIDYHLMSSITDIFTKLEGCSKQMLQLFNNLYECHDLDNVDLYEFDYESLLLIITKNMHKKIWINLQSDLWLHSDEKNLSICDINPTCHDYTSIKEVQFICLSTRKKLTCVNNITYKFYQLIKEIHDINGKHIHIHSEYYKPNRKLPENISIQCAIVNIYNSNIILIVYLIKLITSILMHKLQKNGIASKSLNIEFFSIQESDDSRTWHILPVYKAAYNKGVIELPDKPEQIETLKKIIKNISSDTDMIELITDKDNKITGLLIFGQHVIDVNHKKDIIESKSELTKSLNELKISSVNSEMQQII